ncbi:hypothetical protein M2139_000704 [Enterococcus sp. PF1-24]|uniref:hypothetical protein n=1 Tax=unclassified Enterococcus TaxID=2608891 RepID=UPI002475E722|nr:MULTISPECIES: hypothetical protein [unclassified Enterococcus]MDH6363587.1 hypothetical protein [Enterococcus sp. PFB1-1]MDH6400822.1 hypothetical protein [Enterococcus sp. PF1-24]
MKRKHFIYFSVIFFILGFFFLSFGFYQKQTQEFEIKQLSIEEFSKSEIGILENLKVEEANSLYAFSITSNDQQPIYVELSRKRVFHSQSSTIPEEVFLTYPTDLSSKKFPTEVQLCICQQPQGITEFLTTPQVSNSPVRSSGDLDKKYFCFIPNNSTVIRKTSSIGYCIFTNDKNIIKKATQDNLQNLISDKDVAFEYKISVTKKS